MKANNRLTLRYLTNRPRDAARALEGLPVEDTAALLASIDIATAAPLLSQMLPHAAAACLAHMDESAAAAIFALVKHPTAARTLKAATPRLTQALLDRLQERDRLHIEQLLHHESDTVGAVMDAVTLALPHDITVGEGIKRLQHQHPDSPCGLFVVDGEHKLLGTLSATALLKTAHGVPLRGLLDNPPVILPVYMKLHSALHHVGWQTQRCLPVVARDNTLVGTLEYRTLLSITGNSQDPATRPDAVSSVLNLAGLYWIAMAEILDTVFGRRGDQS